MELYGYEIHREKDLSHHGILGMKWGKQNGPPYPLDASDHSASEKKAGWRQSLKEKRFRKGIDKAKKNNPGKTHTEIANEIRKDFKKNYFSKEQIASVLDAKEKLNKAQLSSAEDKELARKIQDESYSMLDADPDKYLDSAKKEFIKSVGGEKAFLEEYGDTPKEVFWDDAMDLAYYDAASKYPDFKKKLDAIDSAVSNYVNVCSKVTDEIVKTYGDKKVIDSTYGDYGIYVNDLVYTLSKEDLI